MTKKEFVSILMNKGAERIEFNSNNAWGFAGARGHRYKIRNIQVTVAKAGTRHQGEFPFVKAVTLDGDGDKYLALNINPSNDYVDLVPNSKAYVRILEFVDKFLVA